MVTKVWLLKPTYLLRSDFRYRSFITSMSCCFKALSALLYWMKTLVSSSCVLWRLVIWTVVEFGGTSTVAPGLSGMMNRVVIKVLSTDGSRVRAKSPWDPPPKLD